MMKKGKAKWVTFQHVSQEEGQRHGRKPAGPGMGVSLRVPGRLWSVVTDKGRSKHLFKKNRKVSEYGYQIPGVHFESLFV